MSTCRSENVKAKLELVESAIEEIRQEFNKCECMGNCNKSDVERKSDEPTHIMTNKGPRDIDSITEMIFTRLLKSGFPGTEA